MFRGDKLVGILLLFSIIFSLNVSAIITPYSPPPYPDITLDINNIDTVEYPLMNQKSSDKLGVTSLYSKETPKKIIEVIASVDKNIMLIVLSILTAFLFVIFYAKFHFRHTSKNLDDSVINHLASYIKKNSVNYSKKDLIEQLKKEGYSKKIIRKAIRRSKSIKLEEKTNEK